LAPEKNLDFLAQAVADFAGKHRQTHFLVIGAGPSQDAMRDIFAQAGAESRFHTTGTLQGQPLADALHAMDVFAFASTSETQGMVLTEAMAAGLPVVALDAPGVREVVKDRKNGRLLQEATPAAFSAALQWVAELSPDSKHSLRKAAIETADAFSISRTVDKALASYASIESKLPPGVSEDIRDWEDVFSWIETEWDILKGIAGACGAAMGAGLSSGKKDQASP
jgi:1,2-diacylglycerol 3-alpha-glucosyltransferase